MRFTIIEYITFSIDNLQSRFLLSYPSSIAIRLRCQQNYRNKIKNFALRGHYPLSDIDLMQSYEILLTAAKKEKQKQSRSLCNGNLLGIWLL